MNLLYIGAGLDFEILNVKDINVELYFFVDSQPRESHGPNFIKNMKKELKNYGFSKVKRVEFRCLRPNLQKYMCDGVILFRDKNYRKFIYYFYSTVYPPEDENHPLYQFIQKSNILLIKGYEPEGNVIQYMAKPVVLIACENFPLCEKKHSGFFSQIKYERDHIKKFYLWDNKLSLRPCTYEETTAK